MKEAAQSRLMTLAEEKAAKSSAADDKVIVAKVDKKLKAAMVEAKKATVEMEEKVAVATTETANAGDEPPAVKTAVTKLEMAVKDMEQAVTNDEAGKPEKAEKLHQSGAHSDFRNLIPEIFFCLDFLIVFPH